MIPLRPYQYEALQALNAFYAKGGTSGGISLPTGVGKTRIMIAQADQESRDYTDMRRVAVLVDRDVLVEQTERELRKLLPPSTSIGVVKAARNELGAQILVISVHTMRSAKRLAQIPPLKLVIVDEAHMSVSATYKKFFEHVGANQPGGARLAGYSATWTRSDSTGLGDVWQEVVFKRSIAWAIENGFLVRPRAIQLGEGVDLADVRTKGKDGDYRESDLGNAVMLEELRDTMVSGVLKHGGDRLGVLFAPTVESAEYFGDGLRAAGIPTEGIYGELATGERRARHDRHGRTTRILTTCTALAVGWDFPPVSLGIMVRPIRHEGLFVQMVGRLLRTSPDTGKTDALLLDLVRATDEVKLRNAIDLSTSVQREVNDELEDLPPEEPVERIRTIMRRKRSYEVELIPGDTVPWLTGPSGIPFIAVSDKTIVFVVRDRDGYCVGKSNGTFLPDGLPYGKFLVRGLDYDTAREFAMSEALDLGAKGKNSSWYRGKPTERAIAYAESLGIAEAGELTRGELDQAFAVQRSRETLGYFARWSAARLEALTSVS